MKERHLRHPPHRIRLNACLGCESATPLHLEALSGIPDPAIILLPGTRADGRMFDALRPEFPQILVPACPDVCDRPSLIEITLRLTQRMLDSPQVTPGMVIGETSFRGMAALEVAKIIKPRTVVLIGSCRHPSAISQPLPFIE